MAFHFLPILFCFLHLSQDRKCCLGFVDIKWCIVTFCCTLSWIHKQRVLSPYSNKVKSKIKDQISDQFRHCFRLCFIWKFTIIISVLFFWITQLCCVALTYDWPQSKYSLGIKEKNRYRTFIQIIEWYY